MYIDPTGHGEIRIILSEKTLQLIISLGVGAVATIITSFILSLFPALSFGATLIWNLVSGALGAIIGYIIGNRVPGPLLMGIFIRGVKTRTYTF